VKYLTRRAARVKALQALYEIEVGGSDLTNAFEHSIKKTEGRKDSLTFAKTLLTGAWERREVSDRLISKYTRDWNIERLAVIDRNILRIAVFEMTEMPDIPHEVSINEAVELAKIFSTDKAASFINAILDNISKDLKKQGEE